MRQQWDNPARPNPHTTYRACTRCDVTRVTRHEGNRSWTEFHRHGERVDQADGRAPPCERRAET